MSRDFCKKGLATAAVLGALLAASAITPPAVALATQVDEATAVAETTDPYESVAPSHEAENFIYVTGMVSFVYDNGSTGSCAIGSADNIQSIGEPTKNAKGGWDVIVTLKSTGVASDYKISSWQVSDQDSKFIDPVNSKLTIEFSTDSANDSTWAASGAARAKLVFITAPEFDINEYVNTAILVRYQFVDAQGKLINGNSTSIHKLDNVESVGTPYLDANGKWTVEVAIKGASPEAYGISSALLGEDDFSGYEFDTASSQLTMYFHTNSSTGTTYYCTGNERALLVYKAVGDTTEPEPTPDPDPEPTPDPDDQTPDDTTPGTDAGTGANGGSDGSADAGSDASTKTAGNDDSDGKLPKTGDNSSSAVAAIGCAGVALAAASGALIRRHAEE